MSADQTRDSASAGDLREPHAGHPAPVRALAPEGARAVRVLFVLSTLDGGSEQTDIRLLAGTLDPADFRISVVACFLPPGMSEPSCSDLEALGVDVDTAPYGLSFEDTVDYLAGKVVSHDLIVSCQNVADIYPALELLEWRPPLIERGLRVADALAGPKHFTSRYVGSNRSVADAATSTMTGSEAHAVEIPAMVEPSWFRARDESHPVIVAPRWEALFHAVLAERRAAPEPSLFASFVQGGFECSTHRLRSGRRLDLLAATHHASNPAADYAQLAGHGIRTVRDGLRWHLVETTPEQYDWSSFLPMLRAAEASGTQVIWDLMHYGWPDHLDIWSPSFVDQFAAYAAAAAKVVRLESDAAPFYCPINEISFHAWAGGDASYLDPFARHRGFELKVQLVRASIAAMRAILDVEPRARFVHCEPLISIVSDPQRPEDRLAANGARLAQFQAFDMIAGRMWPQLGGGPELLDIVGVNYYFDNQWVHGGLPMLPDELLHKPLRTLLAETYARYGRPILVAETGTEGDARATWFDGVASEVLAARRAGIPVEGICLYPIIDHVGWDDDRDCPSGLMENRFGSMGRPVHQPLADAIDAFRRRSGSGSLLFQRD